MIYLNNAATSWPKPPQVLKAVNNYLSNPPSHSARVGLEKEDNDPAQSCRVKLGKLFNVKDTDRFVFTSGSTESLNLAIKGLDLNGGNVVSTAIEHNSVIRPLKHLELEGKITVKFVSCDKWGYVTSEAIEEAINEETKAVIVNHSSNVTGAILDIKKITEIAHKHDIPIIVDASQSSGAIKIDITNWDIDFLAFTGHKSLFGIQGIGGLYIGDRIKLKPFKVGGTGIKSEVLVQPEGMPIHYEAGTPNVPGIVSLNAGIGFIFETGLENIHKRKSDLVKTMIDRLKIYPEITIYTSEENNNLSNFCFNIKNMVPEEVGYFLDSSYNIVVRTGIHCAPLLLEHLGVHPWGTVRASPSYFTTDEDLETFIKAIEEAVKTFSRNNKK